MIRSPHRAQQLAALSTAELKYWLESQSAAGVEPTLASAGQYAKQVESERGGKR
ncbi:MAG: hypothetical protein WD851_12315 [Pirellulales bacterium]